MQKLIFLFWFLFFGIFNIAAAIQKPPLIFMHIPKSAGVTVSSLLMNEYNDADIRSANPLLYSYGFHASLFEMARQIDTSRYKLITFLREPVSRVLSEQYYCMVKHHGNPEILKAHRLPVNGEPIYTAQNVVCKMLSGMDDNPYIPMHAHLACAKMNLQQKFYFVGIIEKMNESIEFLYRNLDWRVPEEIPHFNLSYPQSYPPAIIKGIKERNWADIELYEFALLLFEEKKNQIRRRTYTPPRIDEVGYASEHYTFDQILRGYGWCLREYYGNSSVRWVTDRNEGAIDFLLKGGQNYLLQFVLYIQPLLASQLQILLNGQSVPIQIDYPPNTNIEDYSWLKVNARIPKELIQEGAKTRLILKMEEPKDYYLTVLYKTIVPDKSINYVRGKFACIDILFQKE